jgi:hypothetical protein
VTDRDILELIATQVGKLTTQVDGLMNQVDWLAANMATKDELAAVKAIVVRIEHDHGQKLGALLQAQKLTSEKLDRIEEEVSREEEIVFKRIE